MILPSTEDVIALHRKYASSDEAYRVIYTHSVIVAEIADRLIDKNNLHVDRGLVQVGALLHDMGAYQLFGDTGVFDEDNYIKHGIFGAQLLRGERLPEPVGRMAERHTGVGGLSATTIISQNLPLPHRDFTAESPEERLVMYADKFHSKDGVNLSQFNTVEGFTRYISKFGASPVAAFTQLVEEFGVPDIEELAVKYGAPVK